MPPPIIRDRAVKDAEQADARVPANGSVTFGTPADASEWQDVRFTVVTGQSYWDLDHPDGFEIYLEARHREEVFEALLRAGEPLGLRPAGLGARDPHRRDAAGPQ